jgi:hypothetical protein
MDITIQKSTPNLGILCIVLSFAGVLGSQQRSSWVTTTIASKKSDHFLPKNSCSQKFKINDS